MIQYIATPTDVLNYGDALGRSCVRKHHDTVGITDAVDALNDLAILSYYLHLVSHRDEATAVCLNINMGQLKSLCEGSTASGNQASVNFQCINNLHGILVGKLDLHRLLAQNSWGDLGREHSGVPVDVARVNQQALGELGNLLVETGRQLVHGLDERHIASESSVHIRKLKANVPTTNDSDPFGQRLQLDTVVTREDRLVVDLNAWGYEGDRSSCNYDVLGSHLATHVRPTRKPILDSVSIDKAGLTLEHIHTKTHHGIRKIPPKLLD
mmetsp:Transcript_4756/g.17077  ORF Transcript_4756/g.17077 Transcript_4756/m.17077 type:complete len:268 (-) Transcript_4756:615-1418(-)